MFIDGQTAAIPAPASRPQGWRIVRDAFLAAVMFFTVFAVTWHLVCAYPEGIRIFRKHKHRLIKVDESQAYPMPRVCWDRG